MEWVLRFFLGGLIVCVFSLVGELVRPRTFAGLFGAAPSVAVVSLGIAFWKHGTAYVGTSAFTMALGAIALASYSLAMEVVLSRRWMAPWLEALLLWLEWGVVAFGGFALVSRA